MTDTRQALAFALACHIKTLRASGRNDGLVEDMERARAALAAQPVAQPRDWFTGGCEISLVSSRVCQRGTKSCVIDHPGAPAPEPKPCNEVPRGNGYCDMCAAGHYERCRYVPAPEPSAQAVPLTDEQVWRDDGIMSANAGAQLLMPCLMELVRAIERAHGIAPKAAQPEPSDEAECERATISHMLDASKSKE